MALHTAFARKCVLLCLILVGLGRPAPAAEPQAATPKAKPILSKASYRRLQPGVFMKRWLVLGAVPVFAEDTEDKGQDAQKKVFESDPFVPKRFRRRVTIDGNEYKWAPLTSEGPTVDLIGQWDQSECMTAYAWARINAAEETRVMLGIGSDDAVKVWLNGKLVHENWVTRGCVKDSDLVPVTLRQGKNHLVLKIQNWTGPWGFAVRRLGSKALAQKLITSAQNGHLDPVDQLLEYGADINGTVGPGLTALHVARIAGRTEAIERLTAKGADADVPMPPKEKIIDWFFNRVIEPKYPGAAVLVARDGEILYAKGYGYADIGHAVKVTPETVFRIGSVSKQFTAAAILKLQEDGKLSVQDKLSKFLPDFPRGDEVTLHHLLTHTSGIHSYTSDPNFMKTVTTEIKPEELVDSIRDYKFDFDPGESQSYCNSGYFLLGYIVEKVSGKSFEEYLQETFFEPLGMKNTGIHQRNLVINHEATGYSFSSGKVEKATNWDMSWAGGAGALYSTVGDLYRWNEGMFNGKVLSESSLEAAFTPATLNSGDVGKGAAGGGSGYGYGWSIGDQRGLSSIAHGGGLHGFSSYLMRLPEENLTVTVLANSLPGIPELSPSGFARQIAEVYLFEKMDEQAAFATDTTVDPSVYDDYVGRYDYGGGSVLTVTRDGDRLLAQMTGQGQAEIFPRSETEFFWKDADAQIEFVRDETGTVTGAIHRQHGAEIKVAKLKDEPAVELDAAVTAAYVGEYEIENVGTIRITKEGGRLHGLLDGQPKFELFARTETEFFLKAAKADVIFTKDENGNVTGLTLKLSGMTFTGKKVK